MPEKITLTEAREAKGLMPEPGGDVPLSVYVLKRAVSERDTARRQFEHAEQQKRIAEAALNDAEKRLSEARKALLRAAEGG